MRGVLKRSVFIDDPQVSYTRTRLSLALLSAAVQRSMCETQAAKHSCTKRGISNLPDVADEQVRFSLLQQSPTFVKTRPPLRAQTQ
jgi:hypothetical protein